MDFSLKEKQYYFNLEKGFAGEQQFANRLEKLSGEWITIYDLLLESNGSLFQIDSLLLHQNDIYLFDVKNFEGDFYIDSDAWYTMSGKEIKNPVHQLSRCGLLLQQFLRNLGYNLKIKTNLIFINPEFTLFQAPLGIPIVLPTQLNRFMNHLQANSRILRTSHHVKLANQILSAHINESPYTKLPKYKFDGLRKGITCASCKSFLPISSNQQNLILCKNCGYKKGVDSAIMRAAREFQLLFPDEKVTTNTIHVWCKVIDSKRTVRRVLSKNFIALGYGKFTYYVNTRDE